MEETEEMQEIISDAVEAFWSVIIDRIPNLDIQKLPPNLDQTVADQMTSAVEKFVEANKS